MSRQYQDVFRKRLFFTGEEPIFGDQQQYKYMTVDDMKSLADDSMRMDVTSDEKSDYRNSMGKYSGNSLIRTHFNPNIH